MATPQFSYVIDETARTRAERMDGKLLLVTNVQDLKPEEVVSRYKSLADIEHEFKVLKSELEIGPVYHRLPDRIRARSDLLHGVDSATGHAQSLTGESHWTETRTRLGAAPPRTVSPDPSQWCPTSIRGVFHPRWPK